MLRDNCTGEHPQAANTALDDGYYFWGRPRVQEMIQSLQWLYDKHPQGKESELLAAMDLLHGCGWNWEDWFVKGVYPVEDLYDLPDSFSDDKFQFLHGVNVGEGLSFSRSNHRMSANNADAKVSKLRQ
jgi:hypothetical protein